MTTDAANNAELDDMSEALTVPRERECLTCYLLRMLDRFGCDSQLRWARRWRDRRVPGAVMLLTSLEARGAYCDCEVLDNVYPYVTPEAGGEPGPNCLGVGRGSTQPCRKTRRQDHDSWEDGE
jgi:hypothetical protein